MDDSLEELLRYAAKLGIDMTGLAPRRLPGRGFGMVATRDIEEGETVLSVPTRALRTLATVPKAVSRRLGRDVSVHGILAADLAADWLDGASERGYGAWNAILPSRDEVAAGMPYLWAGELRELLPTPAKEALAKQQAKLQRDWEGVAKAAAAERAEKRVEERSERQTGAAGRRLQFSHGDYVYAWLLVNSRTFYYTTAQSEAARPHRDDHMAMQPVADLFNHAADHGCRPAYGADGYTFVADRAYAAGSEVHIRYGAHANDALLVEYGFVLGEAAGLGAADGGGPGPNGLDGPGRSDGSAANAWDEVCLDAVVLPRMTRAQRADLDAAGFLGRYMVDAATPGGCFRTQVALRRILYGDARRAAWQQFVHSGGSDGDGDGGGDNHGVDNMAARVRHLLVACLHDLAGLATTTLARIDRLAGQGIGQPSQRALLALRWRQIAHMAVQAAEQLGVDG